MSPLTVSHFVELPLCHRSVRWMTHRVMPIAIMLSFIVTLQSQAGVLNFAIDSGQSVLTMSAVDVDGTVIQMPGSVVGLNITPQDGLASISTSYSGSIVANAQFGSGQLGTIQFLSSNIDANNGGSFFPGPSGSGSTATPGNYGFVMTGEGILFPPTFIRYVDVTNFTLGLTSAVLPMSNSGSDNTFDMSNLSYLVSTGTVGIGYDTIPGPTNYFPLQGTSLINQPTLTQGLVSDLGGGDYELNLQFFELLPLDPKVFNLVAIGNLPVSIVMEGNLVAYAHVPEAHSIQLLLIAGIAVGLVFMARRARVCVSPVSNR